MAASQLHETAIRAGKNVYFTFVDSKVNGASDRWEAICKLDEYEAGRAKGRNQQEAKQRVAGNVLQAILQTEAE